MHHVERGAWSVEPRAWSVERGAGPLSPDSPSVEAGQDLSTPWAVERKTGGVCNVLSAGRGCWCGLHAGSCVWYL